MESTGKRVGKMEAQLKQWGAKIDEMVAAADESAKDAKDDHRRRGADLKTKYDSSRVKLDELKAAGKDTWDTVMTGVDNAYSELECAFESLSSKKG